MKQIFFILLFFSLFTGCNTPAADTNNITDGDVIPDSMLSNGDTDPVGCRDEWTEVEKINDPASYFGVTVVKETESWEWKKNGEADSLLINGDIYDKGEAVHITDNGTIYLGGSFSRECSDVYCEFLDVYRPDGTVVHYKWNRDNLSNVYDIMPGPEKNSVYLLMSFSDHNELWGKKEEYNWNGKVGIGLLKEDGTLTFDAFYRKDFNTCRQGVVTSDGIFLYCSKIQYFRDSKDTIRIRDNVWYLMRYDGKRAMQKEIIDFDGLYSRPPIFISHDAESRRLFLHAGLPGPPEDDYGLWGFTLDLDTMCRGPDVEVEQHLSAFLEYPGGNQVFSGYTKPEFEASYVDEPDSYSTFDGFAFLHIEETKTWLRIGYYDTPPGKNEVNDFTWFYHVQKDDDIYYFYGSSLGDIDDDGTPEDTNPPEIPEDGYMGNPKWRSESVVLAYDSGTNTVYLQQIHTPIWGEDTTDMTQDDTFLYLLGIYVPYYYDAEIPVDEDAEEGDEHYGETFYLPSGDTFLHRIKKSDIISPENIAPDSRVFLYQETEED